MKKFFYIIMMAASLTVLQSCLGDTKWDEYKDWRNANDEWYAQQLASGQYTQVVASWDNSAQVLMRWHNDTMATRDNLKPLISSTVDVKYRGRLYDNTVFDSSYTRTTPADSIFRVRLNSGVIEGWMIALTHMHVGDSCSVIVPYQQGYGSSSTGTIDPYSVLLFDIKLVDIYGYKTN